MAGYLMKDTMREERERIVEEAFGNISANCDGGMTRQMIYHGDHGWSLER